MAGWERQRLFRQSVNDQLTKWTIIAPPATQSRPPEERPRPKHSTHLNNNNDNKIKLWKVRFPSTDTWFQGKMFLVSLIRQGRLYHKCEGEKESINWRVNYDSFGFKSCPPPCQSCSSTITWSAFHIRRPGCDNVAFILCVATFLRQVYTCSESFAPVSECHWPAGAAPLASQCDTVEWISIALGLAL